MLLRVKLLLLSGIRPFHEVLQKLVLILEVLVIRCGGSAEAGHGSGFAHLGASGGEKAFTILFT